MASEISDDDARSFYIELAASLNGLATEEIRAEMLEEGKDPDKEVATLRRDMRELLGSLQRAEAGRRPPAFASLREDRFSRYWNASVAINVVAGFRDTFGTVLFFAVFQTKLGDQPFTGQEIVRLGGIAFVLFIVFAKWQIHLAKSGVEEYLVPLLPSSYFREPDRPGLDSSEGITMAARERALELLKRRHLTMARISLLCYAIWFLAIYAYFHDKLKNVTTAALCVAVMGFFFSRLFYHRLRYLDFVPLLSLEWGPEEEQGTLNDTTFLRVSQTDSNRARLYRAAAERETRLERLELFIVRWLAHGLMGLAAALHLAKLPTNMEGWKQTMGVRQIHDVWEFSSAVLIVFFFTIGAIGYSPKGLVSWMAALVMSSLVVSLYLVTVVRSTTRASERDPGDVFERVTAEAFGVITHDLAKLEYHSLEGESDARTRTLRYQGLFRRTVEVLVDHFETMQHLAGAGTKPNGTHAEIMDFTILLLDLDDFRTCESIFGYSVADHVRFGLASVLRQAALRTGGFVGRPDDDGAVFCMVIPKLGPLLGRQIAEELRIALKERIYVLRSDRGIVVQDGDAALARVDEHDELVQARFPNLGFAGMVLAADTSRGTLEPSKANALRRLIEGADGIVWPSTISIGIASAADLGRRFRDGRLEPDYVKGFRALMQTAHYRLSLAKKKRDYVVGDG